MHVGHIGGLEKDSNDYSWLGDSWDATQFYREKILIVIVGIKATVNAKR